MSLVSLIEGARAWAAADPDPETVAATLALIADGDEAALTSAFGQRLSFGTAGIRGALGPGPGRMSRALVRQVSAGLTAAVLAEVPGAAARGAVIGFDARKNSRIFAEDAAAILAGAGFRVWLFPGVVPTPVLAYAVRYLGAAVGVMVTASHNPPADNGYKVYWENGAQIIPPQDELISAAIDAVGHPAAVTVPALAPLQAAGQVQDPPDGLWPAYVALALQGRVRQATGVKAVYTALHGVGAAPLKRLLAAAGHAPVISVPEQDAPDGAFPTVAFPNPEEKGALDLAIALARREGADLVIANDPDADRLAVAVPDGEGGFRALTGNQVGVLLADDRLRHGAQGPGRLVATTLVSTPLLSRLAAANGVDYAETLTGFKWIANTALRHGGRLVIGFEEALGYAVTSEVADKDGLTAALAFLDLAADCKASGVSLLDRLEAVYRRYGYAASGQKALTLPGADGASRISAAMAHLRQDPPRSLGGTAVRQLRDVAAGTVTDLERGERRALSLPPGDVLAFDLADGSRVLARPSGTEPKIKFYADVLLDLPSGQTLAEVEALAGARVSALLAEVVASAGL